MKNRSTKSKRRSVSLIVPAIILTSLLAGVAMFVYAARQVDPAAPDTPMPTVAIPENDPFDTRDKPLKELYGDEFKALFLSVAYPNTQEITDPPAITGSAAADSRIRQRAEARGYRLSRVPMGAIAKVKDEPRLDTDDLLQPLALEAWYRLKEAARRDGYPVSLLSAYRSPEYQQKLFTERLFARGVTVAQIANGTADKAIDETLELTAVPGYSRHHTGYTIDLWCEDGSKAFVASECYKWISASKYKNAMEYGWIPSYPEGASEQGPEPEPWEYVWVGNAVRQ